MLTQERLGSGPVLTGFCQYPCVHAARAKQVQLNHPFFIWKTGLRGWLHHKQGLFRHSFEQIIQDASLCFLQAPDEIRSATCTLFKVRFVTMGTFVFEALDRPGMEARRLQARDLHRAYIRNTPTGMRCVLGGPLRERADGPMHGTLLVFEADNADDVRTFMANDPYQLADLFEMVTVWEWSLGLGHIVVG
ncbi:MULTISPECIES: YciI family protein [Sphingobium]|nr:MULTISPECIES: YciI family protein [Sphingobium]